VSGGKDRNWVQSSQTIQYLL